MRKKIRFSSYLVFNLNPDEPLSPCATACSSKVVDLRLHFRIPTRSRLSTPHNHCPLCFFVRVANFVKKRTPQAQILYHNLAMTSREIIMKILTFIYILFARKRRYLESMI